MTTLLIWGCTFLVVAACVLAAGLMHEAGKNSREEAIAYLSPIAESASDKMRYGEALTVALDALRAQRERNSIIRDIKADMKPDDTYSVALVLELLGDEQNQPAATDSTPCFPGQSAHLEARP